MSAARGPADKQAALVESLHERHRRRVLAEVADFLHSVTKAESAAVDVAWGRRLAQDLGLVLRDDAHRATNANTHPAPKDSPGGVHGLTCPACDHITTVPEPEKLGARDHNIRCANPACDYANPIGCLRVYDDGRVKSRPYGAAHP